MPRPIKVPSTYFEGSWFIEQTLGGQKRYMDLASYKLMKFQSRRWVDLSATGITIS